jgi:hypothetical protein
MARSNRLAPRWFRRASPWVALAAAAALGGCVAYPAYPGYGYGYGYAPAPYYAYPAGGVVVGGGWGGGWHGGGWR